MISVPQDKVMILVVPDARKIGSIYLPDQAREKDDQGIVKYVGPKVKDLKVGDYVLFSGWTGTSIQTDEEGYMIIMPEDQVICKLHPPATKISGLYHQDAEGNFFPATYESSVECLQKQFYNLPRMANIKDRSRYRGETAQEKKS